MSSNLPVISKQASELSVQAQHIANMLQQEATKVVTISSGGSDFVFLLTVFLLACFVGYYVVWKVTPALHTPLMSVTNAISGVIIVGSMLSAGSAMWDSASILGLVAVFLASINIFGGFMVTTRMLAMFRSKARN